MLKLLIGLAVIFTCLSAGNIAVTIFGAPLELSEKISSFFFITAIFGFIAYMQYKDPSFLRDCDCKCCKDCKDHKPEEFSVLPFLVIFLIYYGVLKISL